MAEFTQNSLTADSQSAGNAIPQNVDLTNVADPLDALNGFNLDQIQSDNPNKQSEPDPQKPKSKEELYSQYLINQQKLQDLANGRINNIFAKSYDPAYASRVVSFDARKFNVDRYLGYGKSTFNRIGFSPFIDNEKRFNENTSWFQDYSRMSSVFFPLAFEGFMGSYRSAASVFSEDEFFDTDDISAENHRKLYGIGNSSRGGITQFGNNFLLSSAYTVGMGTSILAEEALLFGATLATRGYTSGWAAARTGANLARFGNALKKGFTIGQSLGDVGRGGVQLARSLSKVGDAKSFYNAVKSGTTQFLKGSVNFLNPLTRTTDDFIDLYRGSASVRNLSNFAKMSKTFGSFYRDVRNINMALSEGKLEGGSAKLDKIDELIYEYQRKNGKLPEGEDLEKIYKTAEDIGYAVTAMNLPLIFYTNKISLDALFKFRGFKTLAQAGEDASLMSRGIGFKAGKGYFDATQQGIINKLLFPVRNSRVYLGRGLNYFKANFFEGVQEISQEAISKGVSSYYTDIYKDPTLGGTDYALGKTWEGINSQFSKEGAEVFFSGFLMGGLMGRASNLFFRDVPQVFYWSKDKIKGTNKLQEYKQNKKNEREKAIEGLNSLYSDPVKYFGTNRESIVSQKNSADNINLSEEDDNGLLFHDSKDQATFDHIFRALRNGTYDNLLENYQDLMKLDDQDLANYLNIEDSSKAKSKLQEIITRAQDVKNRYETVENQFGNPFDYKQFKKGTPEFNEAALAYVSYEKAKQSVVLSKHSFDRALERMTKLYSDLVSDSPVSNSSNSDFQVLTNLNNIKNEISLLRSEIKTYDENDSEQKKIKKQKEERLEALLDYKEKITAHIKSPSNAVQSEQSDQNEIQTNNTADPLKESYKNYLRVISKSGNGYVFNDKIDQSFSKLLDYYSLDKQSQYFNKVANFLLDPSNLVKHSQAIQAKLTEIWENRESYDKERVESAQRVYELNELIKALSANGIMLDPNEMISFVLNKIKPSVFYDATTKQPLVDGEKLKIANELFERYEEIQEKPEQEQKAEQEVKSEQSAPIKKTEIKPEVVGEEQSDESESKNLNLDPELEKLLKSGYSLFIAKNPDSEVTFEEYIEKSASAARIKSDFEKSKQQPANQTKPEESKKTESTAPPTQKEKPVSDVEVKEYDKPWKSDASKSNKAKSFTLKNKPNEVFELVKDQEEGFYSIHFKTTSKETLTEEEKQKLIKAISDDIPQGSKLSTWGGITKGGISGLNRFKSFGFTESGETRTVKDKSGNNVSIPILIKSPVSNLEAKIADIERRKEIGYSISRPGDQFSFEKNKFVFTYVKPFDINELDKIKPVNHDSYVLNKYGEQKTFDDYDEGEKWLDSKYDAELDALESATPTPQPEILLSGLNGGFQAVSYNSFDPRSIFTLAKIIDKKLSFAKLVEYKGKKYVVVGLSLKTARPTSTIGRDNYSFAAVEYTNNTPADILQTLEKKATENFKNIYRDFSSRDVINPIESVDPEIANLEGKKQTDKSSGIDKARVIVDSISSIKDFPDLQKADSTEASIELMNLIQNGEISAKQVRDLLEKKKTSLLNNIKNDDIEKGDIVILKNGSKGVVFGVNRNDIKVKVFGTPEREYMSIKNDDIKNQILDIKRGKASDMNDEPTNIDVSPADQQEVEASKDTMVDFKKDADSVKKNMQAAEKSVGTDNKGNLEDLLGNIGCKNG